MKCLLYLQEGNRNIYEVASRMTWNADSESWDSLPVVSLSFFATAEAFAHLRYLEEKGAIERKTEGPNRHLCVAWKPVDPRTPLGEGPLHGKRDVIAI